MSIKSSKGNLRRSRLSQSKSGTKGFNFTTNSGDDDVIDVTDTRSTGTDTTIAVTGTGTGTTHGFRVATDVIRRTQSTKNYG